MLLNRSAILGILSIILISPIGFVNAQSSKPVQDIVYNAKFVCGSINNNSGPLRPGHYDTSINILNNKGYRVGFVWTAVINDGPTSNAIFKNLDSETSTGMDCRDIKDIFAIDTKELAEGFVIIKIPVSSLKGFNNEQVVLDYTQDTINVLDVQVFYMHSGQMGVVQRPICHRGGFIKYCDICANIPCERRRVYDHALHGYIGQ